MEVQNMIIVRSNRFKNWNVRNYEIVAVVGRSIIYNCLNVHWCKELAGKVTVRAIDASLLDLIGLTLTDSCEVYFAARRHLEYSRGFWAFYRVIVEIRGVHSLNCEESPID